VGSIRTQNEWAKGLNKKSRYWLWTRSSPRKGTGIFGPNNSEEKMPKGQLKDWTKGVRSPREIKTSPT